MVAKIYQIGLAAASHHRDEPDHFGIMTPTPWVGSLSPMANRIAPKTPRHLYLRQWREARNLTQQAVADHFKVSGLTVSRWERQTGRNKPDTDTLAALAELYGIEPSDFYLHPQAPNLNALVRGQPDAIVEQAARLVTALLK